MLPIQKVITGKENPGHLSAPYQALVQFYCVFDAGNLDMMSENWLQSGDVVMNYPLGDIKHSWVKIQPVYVRIFNGPAEVYVEYFDYTLHETAQMFYTVGRERGYFRLDGEEI